jgi:hypothetical protein
MPFQETQPVPKAWTLLSVIPGLALVIVALGASVTGEPVPLSVVAVLVAVTLALGFWTRKLALITEVDDRDITLRYRGLLKTRVIPISSVRDARPRTYRPIRDYGGWGIKFGPKGWVYNVSGREGVQLQLTEGKPLLIGSRRPDELAEAITSSRGYRGSGRTPPPAPS